MSRKKFVSSASKYVTTWVSFIPTKAVQQVSISCCNPDFLIATETSSFSVFSISTKFSMLQKSMLRQKRVLSRQIFCLQFSIMSQHKLFCSQLTCICFSHSLSRPSSIVNNQIMVLRHKNCCCDSVSLVIAWKFVVTHKFQSRHKLLQLLFFSSFLLEFSPF